MKKLIPILIALLLIPTVLAQDLEISIVSYTPETGSTRLRIYNPTDINYNDVKISIDGKEEADILQRLASKKAISIFPTILPGEHIIKVTSSNGLNFEKTMQFSYSKEQIKQQKEKLAELNKAQLEKLKPLIEQELQEKERPYVITAIILTIIIIIVYFIIRKIRE